MADRLNSIMQAKGVKPVRTANGLKSKFQRMLRKLKPTGSGGLSPTEACVREIQKKIAHQINAGNPESADDQTGADDNDGQVDLGRSVLDAAMDGPRAGTRDSSAPDPNVAQAAVENERRARAEGAVPNPVRTPSRVSAGKASSGSSGSSVCSAQEKSYQTTRNVGQTLSDLTGMVKDTCDATKGVAAEQPGMMKLMEMQMMMDMQDRMDERRRRRRRSRSSSDSDSDNGSRRKRGRGDRRGLFPGYIHVCIPGYLVLTVTVTL